MSVFYNTKRDMLMIMCDACKKTEDLYKHETDRLIAHSWIREHGWKTMKKNDKWINICKECKEALENSRRQKWLAENAGGIR